MQNRLHVLIGQEIQTVTRDHELRPAVAVLAPHNIAPAILSVYILFMDADFRGGSIESFAEELGWERSQITARKP